jgi:hypothetical protein
MGMLVAVTSLILAGLRFAAEVVLFVRSVRALSG